MPEPNTVSPSAWSPRFTPYDRDAEFRKLTGFIEEMMHDAGVLHEPGVQHEPTNAIRTWDDVPTLAQIPHAPVEWLVEGMVPRGAVVLLAGESGSYKTWLAMCLARGVARGEKFLGRRCATAEVLYLDRENPPALVHERAAALALPEHSDLRVWGGWACEQPPGIGDARILEIAKRSPLVVFDSFIRFHEGEENSATEMARVMYELRLLANAGATVVVLHHKPKGEGSHYRGSSDIQAGVDVAFSVSADRDAGVVRFACFKHRFAPEFKMTLRPAFAECRDFVVTENSSTQDDLEDFALQLDKIIVAHPGLTQSELVERAPTYRKRVIQILNAWEGKLWRCDRGINNCRRYYSLGENSADQEGQENSVIPLSHHRGGDNGITGTNPAEITSSVVPLHQG